MNVVRRGLYGAGARVRALLIGCIKVYRVSLSGWLGGQCRFYPSCSRYAEDAIRVHGAVRGSGMAVWRLLRCNPFGNFGVDLVEDVHDLDPSLRARFRQAVDLQWMRNRVDDAHGRVQGSIRILVHELHAPAKWSRRSTSS